MSAKRFFDRSKPLVYLITEGRATTENFYEQKRKILEIIKIAVRAQIDLIQLREKNLPTRLAFELAAQAAEITRRTKIKLLINDRADIALAARADGVHLTARSLDADIIRKNFPPDFIVGVSAHTLAEAENARRRKADFITFSPIFSTPEKEKYGAPQGLENLRAVCEKLNPFPVFALGGIDADNYKKILECGACGFAAIRFLNAEESLKNLDLPQKLEL